jgi:soluble lytic murein transglycosylase-like protein
MFSGTFILTLLLGVSIAGSARACWDQAASRYGVSAELLYAVARVESDLNPQAVNRSHLQRTGSYDIGLMQINSRHLPTLARYGITERHLYEPCTNIQVGAWLLADVMSRHGASWEAVGAYNAACTQLKGPSCQQARSRYAWRVYQKLPSVTPPRLASTHKRSEAKADVRVASAARQSGANSVNGGALP